MTRGAGARRRALAGPPGALLGAPAGGGVDRFSLRDRRVWSLWAVGVLAAVLVLGMVAVRFAPPGSSVALWWPAAGLGVAFLLATGADTRRAMTFVAGVVVASGVANWLGGRPPFPAACFGVSNAAEAAVVWALMTRGGRRPQLVALEDLIRLLLATLAGAATFGVLAGATVRLTLGGDFLPTAYAVTTSHTAAVLVIAPLGLTATSRRIRPVGVEDAVQWLALIGVTGWVFSLSQGLPLAFLPLPVLVWGATRLPLRTVAWQLIVVGVIAVVLTNRGGGPFAAALRLQGVRAETVGALTQAFLVTAAITALVLTVVTGQRRRALADLGAAAQFATVVLDTAASAIVVLDGQGRIVRLNRTATRYLGADDAELVGRRAADVYPLTAEHRAAHLPTEAAPEAWQTTEQDWDVLGLGVRRMVWSSSPLPDGEGQNGHVVQTGTDVTDERAARTFIETILSSATATAMIGTDRHGVITLFNRGATNLLGYEADDVVGKVNWVTLHDPAEIADRARELGVEAGAPVLVHAVTGSGATETRDWTWVTRDGRRIVVDETVSAIVDSAGRTTGYLGVAEDVTERRAAGEAVTTALAREREALRELVALDRAKSDFLSSVTHELRTPLASVMGYAEMLEDGAVGVLSSRQLELVARIDRNARRLLELVEDLLATSAIEFGELELTRRRCDLARVADDAWEATRTMTRKRDLSLRKEVLDRPIWVDADPDALARVVRNLLSNAVKFTPDGGEVELVLTDAQDDGAPPGARIIVRDTGVGIPDADQKKVFQRFFRSGGATEQAVQGAGLGLSIVRAIVEAHAGSVELTSTVGEGSTFTVRLPLASGPRAHAEPGSGAAR